MSDPESGSSAVTVAMTFSAGDVLLMSVSLIVVGVAVAASSALRHYRWPRLEKRLAGSPLRALLDERLDGEQDWLDRLQAVRLIFSVAVILSLATSFGLTEEVLAFDWLARLVTVLLVSLAWIVVFHGLVRGIARAAPERTLLLLHRMAWGLALIGGPLVAFSTAIGNFFARACGIVRTDSEEEEAREEILEAVSEGERDGAIDDDEREMIENIIEVREQAASAVMTPRTSVFALPLDTPLESAVERIIAQGHSRIPVYGESIDDVRGVLYAKDILAHFGQPRSELPTTEDLIRKPLFVPETKNTGALLQELKGGKVHLAVVLDEYGGMAGIVTIEDILEEIVGEIEDEHDPSDEGAAKPLVLIEEGEAEVSALVHIDELNEALEIDLPESEGYDTVGGMVFARLGRVPAVGETCEVDGVRFEVLEAEERRIQRVRVSVELPAEAPAAPAGPESASD